LRIQVLLERGDDVLRDRAVAPLFHGKFREVPLHELVHELVHSLDVRVHG
jgi:hypothetical protein